MSSNLVTITWTRDGARFTDNRYSRVHSWQFDGGFLVPASSSPDVVPVPYSDPANVDPEEAFIAALSSCHMLWFLSIAAKRGFVVDSYIDHAAGKLAQNETGQQVMTVVVLHPEVVFSSPNTPEPSEVDAIHHAAHESCFLANSVKTEIQIRGVWSVLRS